MVIQKVIQTYQNDFFVIFQCTDVWIVEVGHSHLLHDSLAYHRGYHVLGVLLSLFT